MSKHIRVNKDAGDVESGIVAFNGAIAEDLSYQEERRDLIARLESKGYFYNWDKFDNRQLYRMATEKPARTKRKVATPIKNIEIKYCEECGTRLTDGGYCPVCDDGEEHLEENMENNYTISYENLPVTRQTEKRVVGGYPGWEEWDEVEDTVNYDLELSVEEVDEGLLGIDQIWDEPGINDDNSLDYVDKHRDELFNKYQVQLKNYYSDLAIERAQAAVNDDTLGSEPYTEYDYREDEYMDRARGIEESFLDDVTYEEVASKSVEDSDGFMTDYTWYRTSDGNNIFVFGDKDIYTPDTTEWDWEEESDEAAQDWFDSYIGFGDPDDFVENLEEATDVGVVMDAENSRRIQGRAMKGDAADVVMEYHVDFPYFDQNDGRYIVKDPDSKTRVVVQFDLDHTYNEHKFTVDGVEYITTSDREVGKIIEDAVKEKHRKSFDINIDESIIESSTKLDEVTINKDYSPKKTGQAYKVFRVKDGKLYPPMVANAGGEDTPVGVWIDAEEGEFAGRSKTGRPQVKSIGSGTLAYRPGWHLGDVPRAPQFDRTNKETGEKEFPKDFVWALCDYAMDIDYQDEADARGYERTKVDDDGDVVTTKSDKYQHSLAGLPKLPKDGYYKYRTNPRPDTAPWVITGHIRVTKLLSDDEVNAILESKGVEPIHRQGGDKTLGELGLGKYESLREGISSRGDGTEWFVGDDESGYIYYSEEDAKAAYDYLVKIGVENPVMDKLEESQLGDDSEVGELGHPIQQGIGDPRRKREQDAKNIPVKESADPFWIDKQ